MIDHLLKGLVTDRNLNRCFRDRDIRSSLLHVLIVLVEEALCRIPVESTDYHIRNRLLSPRVDPVKVPFFLLRHHIAALNLQFQLDLTQNTGICIVLVKGFRIKESKVRTGSHAGQSHKSIQFSDAALQSTHSDSCALNRQQALFCDRIAACACHILTRKRNHALGQHHHASDRESHHLLPHLHHSSPFCSLTGRE